ncbi:hypothetical protein [Desulfobacter sp.]
MKEQKRMFAAKIPEKDWKYLRKIEPDMLATLCGRINERSKTILNEKDKSEYKKYLQLYKHIKQSDKVVADCFNDWRRSNIWLKILLLRQHNLLTDENLDQMSDQCKAILQTLSKLGYT